MFTKSVRVLMSMNPPQLLQKGFLIWCQWNDLSCHKKHSCFDVNESTSAVTKTVRVLMLANRPRLLLQWKCYKTCFAFVTTVRTAWDVCKMWL